MKHKPCNLVIGCARSGTTFLTAALRNAGLRVIHEKNIGKNGAVGWNFTFGVHPGWRDTVCIEDYSRFDHIFHLIRDPLDCIPSCTTFKQRSWDFIYKCLPEISAKDNLITRCVKYWCLWNKAADKRAEERIHLEQISKNFQTYEPLFREKFGIEKPRISMLPKSKLNRRRHRGRMTPTEIKREVSSEVFYELERCARYFDYPFRRVRDGDWE